MISSTEHSWQEGAVGAPNPAWEGPGRLPGMVTLSQDKKAVVETEGSQEQVPGWVERPGGENLPGSVRVGSRVEVGRSER